MLITEKYILVKASHFLRKKNPCMTTRIAKMLILITIKSWSAHLFSSNLPCKMPLLCAEVPRKRLCPFSKPANETTIYVSFILSVDDTTDVNASSLVYSHANFCVG
jgi:hypothetical protein